MIDKLKEVKDRFLQIEAELAKPETMADMELYTKRMREYKSLQPVVEKYNLYEKFTQDYTDAAELMETEPDEELRALAQEEYHTLRDQIARTEEELKNVYYVRGKSSIQNRNFITKRNRSWRI